MGVGIGCGCQSLRQEKIITTDLRQGFSFDWDEDTRPSKKKRRKKRREMLSTKELVIRPVTVKREESIPKIEITLQEVSPLAISEVHLVKDVNHTPAENKITIELKYVNILSDEEEPLGNEYSAEMKGKVVRKEGTEEKILSADESVENSVVYYSKDLMETEENFEGSVIVNSTVCSPVSSEDEGSREHTTIIQSEYVDQNEPEQDSELVFSASEVLGGEELGKMPPVGEAAEVESGSEEEKSSSRSFESSVEEADVKLKVEVERTNCMGLMRAATMPQRVMLRDLPQRMTTSRRSVIAKKVLASSKSPFISDRELRVKKRKLVDAYMEAIPSSRRQLTLLSVAVDKIWADVTETKGNKVRLKNGEYRKELAWLKSRLADPVVMISPRDSIYLEKALNATRSTLHDRFGVDRRESILGWGSDAQDCRKSVLEAKTSLRDRSGVTSPFMTPRTSIEKVSNSPAWLDVFSLESMPDKIQPDSGLDEEIQVQRLLNISGMKD